MPVLPIGGRILFLSADPEKVAAQLSGARLSLREALPLRDDVSTDEITPVAALSDFAQLAGKPYIGFKAGDRLPIAVDSVRLGAFSVTVAGKRYGKGSSREQSPVSERAAGIRLVIAESFERIYRQNADNVGLFTSTDLGLIERIGAGEEIDFEELLATRDQLASSILRAGGLLQYGATRMKSIVRPACPVACRPMTLAGKILARHAVQTDETSADLRVGMGAFVRPDWRFILEVYTGMASHLMHSAFGDPLTLADPPTIIGFAEHFPYVHKSPGRRLGRLASDMDAFYRAHVAFCEKYGLKSHGYLVDRDGSEGISHPLMAEHYALPGQLVVGTDSHTPHCGALGCIAYGIGATDMANAILKGIARLTVPEDLLIDVQGRLPPGVSAKDLVLHLLADPRFRQGIGVGRILEFSGPAVQALPLDERATLTNMAAELGGFTGIVAPDEETVRFLRERRGVEFELEPWMRSDPDAPYGHVISVDATGLSPFVARPGDPGNSLPLAQLKGRPRIDIAFGGTCTAGKRADFDAYHEVIAWALQHGRKVHPGVSLYLQFGTVDVRNYCDRRGYLEVFRKAGAVLLEPACGACADLGPGASERADQVTVSAQNRNFPGRSGPGQMWLASPATVAASAVAGRLSSFAELVAGTG